MANLAGNIAEVQLDDCDAKLDAGLHGEQYRPMAIAQETVILSGW